MRYLTGILLLCLLGGAVSARADGEGRDIPIVLEPTIYLWRGLFSPETASHEVLEGAVAGPLGSGPFVYEHPMPPPVGLLQLDWRTDEDGPINYYNFRGGLLLLSSLANRWLSDDRYGREMLPSFGWHTHLLYLHNSSYKWRISRNLRLAAATRTDLLPLRVHGDDQGVLFTPEIALELVGLSWGYEHDMTPLTNRLHVGLGHSWWWSFEGRDRTPGWTLVVGVAFLAGV